jgi:hypothetical protein
MCLLRAKNCVAVELLLLLPEHYTQPHPAATAASHKALLLSCMSWLDAYLAYDAISALTCDDWYWQHAGWSTSSATWPRPAAGAERTTLCMQCRLHCAGATEALKIQKKTNVKLVYSKHDLKLQPRSKPWLTGCGV